jgi:hypothetical protein
MTGAAGLLPRLAAHLQLRFDHGQTITYGAPAADLSLALPAASRN